MIKLIKFKGEHLEMAWGWLQEFPECNFHDETNTTFEEFAREVDRRVATELIFIVTKDDAPVGMIGFKHITKRLGMLNGVCFSKEVHGKGIAYKALRHLLQQLCNNGTEKIAAIYFAHNEKIRGLLKSIGFVDEGLLRKQFIQNGQEIDAFIVAYHGK